jgi:riboflavin kinase / FMN adenylyltransferase
MELIYGANHWPDHQKTPLFLALGNFDGVHRGHQTILNKAIAAARHAGGRSAAMIFDPHPAVLLWPEQPFSLLTDIADRSELMGRLGLDYLLVEPFTEQLADLTPEQFVKEILINRLNVAEVVVGHDYSFGRGGAGKAETMQQWGRELGFSVSVCPLVRFNQKVLSSSAIRALLLSGAVAEAAELLDYYFFRRGKVVTGSGIGKQLVYPTANLSVSPNLIWPGKGVYLTAVGGCADRIHFGVTNVGARPTFARSQAAAETHILDFNGDLYNRELCLYFLEKLRETETFATPRQLKEQVSRDIARGRKMLNTRFQDLAERLQLTVPLSCPAGLMKKI